MKKNRIKNFSQLPSNSVHSEIKRLLEKTQEANLSLLFYKLLPFYFERRELTQGLEPKNFAEKFYELLKNGIKAPYINLHLPKCEKSFKLKTAYRFVIGMGYPSLLENGFLFHHTYGIPYIPGETLKGLAIYVLLLSIYEELNGVLKDRLKEESLSSLEAYLLKPQKDFEKEQLTKELENREIAVVFSEYKIKNPHIVFRRLFGTLEKGGEVIFFDAYPKNFKPTDLELDIMNPHYSKYYQSEGKEPPGDWENPVPVKFLTLKKGVCFMFCLSSISEDRSDLLEPAKVLLRVGLENFGVGGKKAKGYGWFEPT